MIGNTLRDARARRGWSQARLAEEIGVSKKTVSAYEASGMAPGKAVLDKLEAKMPELAGAVAKVRGEIARRRSFSSNFARAPQHRGRAHAQRLRREEFAKRRATAYQQGDQP
jgi:transcriptional regulator with XRE-family HTH domain